MGERPTRPVRTQSLTASVPSRVPVTSRRCVSVPRRGQTPRSARENYHRLPEWISPWAEADYARRRRDRQPFYHRPCARFSTNSGTKIPRDRRTGLLVAVADALESTPPIAAVDRSPARSVPGTEISDATLDGAVRPPFRAVLDIDGPTRTRKSRGKR